MIAVKSLTSSVFRPSFKHHGHCKVVDDSTDNDRQPLECEILKYLREKHFADDNRRESDNYRASAHIDIGKILILREHSSAECDETVREHKSENDISVSVDALSTCHALICACRAEGAAALGSEEPVEQGNYTDNKREQDKRGGNYG